MTDKTDSTTVKTIIKEFLKNDGVRARLKMLRKFNRNDWEKWLQVELEYFISNSSGISVKREVQAFPDNRKLRNRFHMFIDLAFRRVRSKYNSYIFLELKCTREAQSLINGFETDIKKYNSINYCMYESKSFWCVGFHFNCDQISRIKMKNYVKKWDYGYYKVINLCDCGDGVECNCTNSKIGVAII